MQDVNLEGLNEQQREFLARIADLFRESNIRDARKDFAQFWGEWSKRMPVLEEAEAEQIVAEAVAYARSNA
jgi:hypothetical protein